MFSRQRTSTHNASGPASRVGRRDRGVVAHAQADSSSAVSCIFPLGHFHPSCLDSLIDLADAKGNVRLPLHMLVTCNRR